MALLSPCDAIILQVLGSMGKKLKPDFVLRPVTGLDYNFDHLLNWQLNLISKSSDENIITLKPDVMFSQLGPR